MLSEVQTGNGSYVFIHNEARLLFENNKDFLVILSGGFSVYGLVGTEYNGVAIFDNVMGQVVCDQIGIVPPLSGFVTQEQQEEFDRIIAMNWEDFRKFVNAHPRTRYQI